MTPEERAAAFTARVTQTVLSVQRDGSKYRNTETGETGYGVRMHMDCGHVVSWRPLGQMQHPRRGDREMCSACIDAALPEFLKETAQ